MSGAGYYDLDAILAEETLVPAVFQNGACNSAPRQSALDEGAEGLLVVLHFSMT